MQVNVPASVQGIDPEKTPTDHMKRRRFVNDSLPDLARYPLSSALPIPAWCAGCERTVQWAGSERGRRDQIDGFDNSPPVNGVPRHEGQLRCGCGPSTLRPPLPVEFRPVHGRSYRLIPPGWATTMFRFNAPTFVPSFAASTASALTSFVPRSPFRSCDARPACSTTASRWNTTTYI